MSSKPGVDSAMVPASSGLPSEVASWVGGDRSVSAFALVPRAEDALKARIALIDSATTSIDIKYFIWKGDASSRLIFSRVLAAVARGVRVRILVDDLNLAATDAEMSSLDNAEGLSIRIWNPSQRRSILGTLADYAEAFDSMNKRMHNKMILTDGHLGLIGGRNIADEYFGLTNKYNFLDLDVVVAGPIVGDVGSAFDDYWNADLAVPPGDLTPADPDFDLEDFTAQEESFDDVDTALLARFPTSGRDWASWFEGVRGRWHLGKAVYLQDEPVAAGEESKRLAELIDDFAAEVDDELDVVSAYLLPSDRTLNTLKQIAASGARVRVLTGTQESVNHTAAYAHYRKDRGRILDTGAELYEIDGQPSPDVRRAADTPPAAGKYVAIHLKGMVADRKECFIGSLNLDPRAMDINTEGGLLVTSEGLGEELAELVDHLTSPENGWHVVQNDDGALEWHGKGTVQNQSPDRGGVQEAMAKVFGVIPIRSQL
ncbi:MAG: phospholipase D family protein [Acidimicrobiia bacterium]